MEALRRIVLVASALCFCAAASEPPPEVILPEHTLLALSVPDFSSARAAFQKTRLAAMLAEPEMQQFLAPACEQMRKNYEQLRAKNPLLPVLSDLAELF